MKKKSRFFLSAIILLSLYSCKKDKLKEDSELLVGEWEWVYSDKTLNECNPPSSTNVIDPFTETKTYTMKFYKKGVVELYQDSKLANKHRIVLVGMNEPVGMSNLWYFEINLDNDKSSAGSLDGFVGDTTLKTIRGYPYYDSEDQCETYTNHFVRIQ